MTFKFPTILRTILIAGAVPALTAAGQFPIGPLTAVHAIALASFETAAASDEILSVDDQVVAPERDASETAPIVQRPALLATLVAQVAPAASATGERDCLARAVYFEARGEPLEGQLAVAQVILNRVASGRFAGSVCGVIAQPGQFSFDRSRTPADGRDWRVAKAIATIAATAQWDVMAPRAINFHATRVNASWTSMRKVGTIGNHVFYR